MPEQTENTATKYARRRVTARRILLPDAIAVKCPAGTRRAIEKAAEGDGMPVSDWLRQTLRLALEEARQRRERKAARR